MWSCTSSDSSSKSLFSESSFSSCAWDGARELDVAYEPNSTVINTLKQKEKYFYHINCGVIQGFPALRKAATAHVKKKSYFFTCGDIANRLLTRHSPLAPPSQVEKYEQQGLHNSQYKLFMAAKTLKNPYRWQTVRFKILRRGRKSVY